MMKCNYEKQLFEIKFYKFKKLYVFKDDVLKYYIKL